MLTLILTNEQVEFEVQVTSIENLFEVAKSYFEYQYENIALTHNGVVLNTKNDLNFFGIGQYDFIFVGEAVNKFDMEELDALNYSSPYVLATIGDLNIGALVDTGATTSVITKKLARVLNILDDTNTFLKGSMTGLGKVSSMGVIHNINMKINNTMVTSVSLRVMDDENSNMLILGMGWLNKNNCIIDITKRTMQCNGHTLQFLNEGEMETYKNVVSNKNNISGDNKKEPLINENDYAQFVGNNDYEQLVDVYM
jgi:predicted aspartyl protease